MKLCLQSSLSWARSKTHGRMLMPTVEFC
uniref:Cl5118_1 n=1 Tax=Arundo donax TaxID=35708 RepID=A0A0A8XZ25_ARUDO